MNKRHEQIVNCTALMAGLAALPEEAYNHISWTCGTAHCAGGWAAVWGIGGLAPLARILHRDGAPKLSGMSVVESVDEVFGVDAFENIFVCEGSRLLWTRADVIQALCDQVKYLSGQHEGGK